MKLSLGLQQLVTNYESCFQAGIFVSRKDYRITESLRLEGTPGGHLAQPADQAGSPTASCPGLCPDGFWPFPRLETPQPLCATCASAWSPSQLRSVSLCSDRSSYSVCAHCLLSCHWTPSSLHPPFRYLYTLMRPRKHSLLQARQPQLSQLFLMGDMHRSLKHLSGPQHVSSNLSMHGCVVLGPVDLGTFSLFKYSLNCSSSTKDKSSFLQTFTWGFLAPDSPPRLWGLELLKATLASKDWGKGGIQYFNLLHVLCHQSPCSHLAVGPHFPQSSFCYLFTYRSPSYCHWCPLPDCSTGYKIASLFTITRPFVPVCLYPKKVLFIWVFFFLRLILHVASSSKVSFLVIFVWFDSALPASCRCTSIYTQT